MKFAIILIAFSLAAIVADAQPVPQSDKLTERYFSDADSIKNVTPALQKKRGFTDYDELIVFLERLQKTKPELINLSYIGESQKGYQIPLIHLVNKNAAGDKVKVWLQAGLHGNEPGSTESLLYLLHELVNNPELTYLLDKLEIAAVPMANIDGYLKQDRYAANGLDLNRDQTKLMAPESVLLKKSFSNYNAEVALDFHEYNPFRKDFSKLSSFGVMSLYDVMFLTSGNLNVSQKTRTLTDSLFKANAGKILDTHKITHHDYVSTTKVKGEIHFNQGSNSARSSATSYALSNAISSLIEVRGVNLYRTSFKRRIASAYLVGLSYLQTAYENVTLVKQTVNDAQNERADFNVITQKTVYENDLQFIDIDTKEIVKLKVTIRDASLMIPKLTRERPSAYIINLEQLELIEKIKTLGIQVVSLEKETRYNVEAYQVIVFERDSMKYEKMNMQAVETVLEKKSISFPSGTFVIYTNQKNAPLLAEVLEPEAPNSFVSFGVLETSLNKELPIYRLPKTN
jgi:hypothetical protein